MQGNVRIISDGTSRGTKVLVDGVAIQHVARLEILPIEPDGIVRAVVEVIGPDVEMVAQLTHHETMTLKLDAAEIDRAMHEALLTVADDLELTDPAMATRLREVVKSRQ